MSLRSFNFLKIPQIVSQSQLRSNYIRATLLFFGIGVRLGANWYTLLRTELTVCPGLNNRHEFIPDPMIIIIYDLR